MALCIIHRNLRGKYFRWNFSVSGVHSSCQYSTAAHTLRVNQQIKENRKRALLGGGQDRIDTQHKKVFQFSLTPCGDQSELIALFFTTNFVQGA